MYNVSIQKIINLVEKLKIPLNSSNLKYDTFTLCYTHYYEFIFDETLILCRLNSIQTVKKGLNLIHEYLLNLIGIIVWYVLLCF